MTPACEDANSKLVEVVTVDVGNRSLQIWKLGFCHGAKLKTFSTKFGQEFEVEVQARF